MSAVDKIAAPASRNIDIGGYGSRLKAGTTPSHSVATLAYFLIQFSNRQFRHCERSKAIQKLLLRCTALRHNKPSYPRMRVSSTLRFLIPSSAPRNTGSSAFADNDDRKCGVLSLIKCTSTFSRHEVPESCKNHPPPNIRGRRESRVLGAPAAPRAKCRKHASASPQVRRNTRPSLRNGFNGFLRALPGDRAFLSPSSPRSWLLKNLTPASRRQDHTTSPSASQALSSMRYPRPPHPAPRP
jgi:hypothetical protein